MGKLYYNNNPRRLDTLIKEVYGNLPDRDREIAAETIAQANPTHVRKVVLVTARADGVGDSSAEWTHYVDGNVLLCIPSSNRLNDISSCSRLGKDLALMNDRLGSSAVQNLGRIIDEFGFEYVDLLQNITEFVERNRTVFEGAATTNTLIGGGAYVAERRASSFKSALLEYESTLKKAPRLNRLPQPIPEQLPLHLKTFRNRSRQK